MRMDLLGALQFPIGHPIADQLYVAHPYISGRYIPFEDYDLTFLEDRLREFCWLAQCLGATEVTIESEKDKSFDNKVNTKKALMKRIEKIQDLNSLEISFLLTRNLVRAKNRLCRTD